MACSIPDSPVLGYLRCNISYTLESELRFIPVTSVYHTEQCQAHSEHLKPLLLLAKVLKKSFWKSEEFIYTVYIHPSETTFSLHWIILNFSMP